MSRAKRALLAEDDPVQRDLAIITLDEVGIEVVVAADGHAARERLAREAFDVAVLDINLPHVDGLSLVRETRAGGLNMATPIVIMTGQNDDATALSAYQTGATSFIDKPIDWSDFARRVSLVLSSAEKMAENEQDLQRMQYWLARSMPG